MFSSIKSAEKEKKRRNKKTSTHTGQSHINIRRNDMDRKIKDKYT